MNGSWVTPPQFWLQMMPLLNLFAPGNPSLQDCTGHRESLLGVTLATNCFETAHHIINHLKIIHQRQLRHCVVLITRWLGQTKLCTYLALSARRQMTANLSDRIGPFYWGFHFSQVTIYQSPASLAFLRGVQQVTDRFPSQGAARTLWWRVFLCVVNQYSKYIIRF